MAQPDAYVGGAAGLFDEAGRIANDGTRTLLESFMSAFARLVNVITQAST